MTIEEAKEIFLNRGYIQVKGGRIYDGDKWRESVVVISKWLEQQPTAKENLVVEDAISRQQALYQAMYVLELETSNDNEKVEEMLRDLPSVHPKPKTGHWIIVETLHGEWEGTKKYACDNCGKRVGVFKSNYCPNCGAKMIEPQESEDKK